MRDPRLLQSLPLLVEKGLITSEQALLIRSHVEVDAARPNRLMLLYSILGSLLIGLGIILMVAHNWEDLSRNTRTVLAFLPLAAGQSLVLYSLLRAPLDRGWREGASLLLFLAVGACMALISQIYHIEGSLDGFLLTWSLLVVMLLFVPGSIISLILYLGMITWYAVLLRSGIGITYPWYYIPLLVPALVALVRQGRAAGDGTGFFWAALTTALSVGIAGQLFWQEPHPELALGIAGLACACLLIPVLVNRPHLRLGGFTITGAAAMIGVLIFASYSHVWRYHQPMEMQDRVVLFIMLGTGLVAYAVSTRRRRPFSGGWLAESFLVLLISWSLAQVSAPLAAFVVNAWLLVLGVHMAVQGMWQQSLRRMNTGLALAGLVIMLRFFDLNMDDALKGLIFILIGAGFLLLNVHQIRQRGRPGHA